MSLAPRPGHCRRRVVASGLFEASWTAVCTRLTTAPATEGRRRYDSWRVFCMNFVGMPVVVKGNRSLIGRMKMEDGDRQKCPAIGVHMYHLDRPS